MPAVTGEEVRTTRIRVAPAPTSPRRRERGPQVQEEEIQQGVV